MIPGIDSTKLKYLSDCLLSMKDDAPACLGNRIMDAKSKGGCMFVSISATDEKEVIKTDPTTVLASDLRNGLDRYKGTISFSRDGTYHKIGTTVTVNHNPTVPDKVPDGLYDFPLPYHASIHSESIREIVKLIPDQYTVIYVKNDSNGHYFGILDSKKIQMKGNSEPNGYISIQPESVRILAKLSRGDVSLDWMPEKMIRFSWRAYGMFVNLYVSARKHTDPEIVKKLDDEVILCA